MAEWFAVGKADAQGRALLLVHGAGGSHALWGLVVQELRRRGIPAVALDLPGHGRSGGEPRTTVEAYARDVEEAAGRLGAARYVAVGHSMGGAVVLTLGARRAPGLAGVGAVSTGARLPVDPMILRGAREAFQCTVENLARFCFAQGTPEEIWRDAARTLAAAGPGVLYADFTACDGFSLGDEELARVEVPVEVVCGTVDVLTPLRLSEELAARLPRAHLTRLEGCGHMPLIEAPQRLGEALGRLWDRAFGGGG
ncbi:MAG: alpha/beta hydrolase [Deferrisomatales bacterium]